MRGRSVSTFPTLEAGAVLNLILPMRQPLGFESIATIRLHRDCPQSSEARYNCVYKLVTLPPWPDCGVTAVTLITC